MASVKKTNWDEAVKECGAIRAGTYDIGYLDENDREDVATFTLGPGEGEAELYICWTDFCIENCIHPERVLSIEAIK